MKSLPSHSLTPNPARPPLSKAWPLLDLAHFSCWMNGSFWCLKACQMCPVPQLPLWWRPPSSFVWTSPLSLHTELSLKKQTKKKIKQGNTLQFWTPRRKSWLRQGSLGDSLVLRWLGSCRRSSGKESAYQCRRHKRLGFDLWVGKILWRKIWWPTPVSLPGKFQGQRNLADCCPWILLGLSSCCNYLSTHVKKWNW